MTVAKVVFFEKPGCGNNTRQKAWLAAAGHEVDARSLLTEAWTPERLRAFFGERPVAEWFNRASPRVKSGEVVPEEVNADQALDMMVADPLLIRRPLIESAGRRSVGFDPEAINAWLGLDAATVARLAAQGNPEGCLHPQAPHGSEPCPPPG